MGPTALFDNIHGLYCTISANFYLYLQYFQQKVFNFNKISEFQIDPKRNFQQSHGKIAPLAAPIIKVHF